ncbi:MAG: endonuclease V [Bacteroidota bacterium]
MKLNKHTEQIKAWEAEQNQLFKQLKYTDHPETWPQDGLVLSLDIQYEGDFAHTATDLSQLNGKSIGIQLNTYPVEHPYVSGYFSFREGPILFQAVEKILEKEAVACVIVDGHGRAHPRKMGLACWLGIKLDIPTIGVAKRSLLNFDAALAPEKNALYCFQEKQDKLGWAWRSRENVKPIFVSPGHRMGAELALEIVKQQAGPYRQIESLRRADHYARKLAKGQINEGYVSFSGQ